MTELSPAAQAVAKAALYVSSCDSEEYPYQAQEIAAAVLCAAADQVVPEEPLYYGDMCWEFKRDERQHCRQELLCIANELEAQ